MKKVRVGFHVLYLNLAFSNSIQIRQIPEKKMYTRTDQVEKICITAICRVIEPLVDIY